MRRWLNNKDGLRLVHNISNLLQEFPEYHYLTLIDYLLNTNKKYELEFDKKINFNIITLPKDFSLRKNLKNIIKCIY